MTPADSITESVDPSRRGASFLPAANGRNLPVSHARVQVIGRRQRRSLQSRLLLFVLVLAIVMLAIGGWVVQAFTAVVDSTHTA
jgi:hypothetical protein